MKSLRRILGVAFLLSLVVVVGMMAVNYSAYSSKQVPVKAIPPIQLPDTIVNALSKAIQLPTISNNLSSQDSTYFKQLHQLLNNEFPLVDSMLERKIIADLSMVYHWRGKRPDLTPILLIAHTDVVPIEEASREEWNFEPFDGTVADGYIWGRGTLDNKANVVGILTAIEQLLKEGYLPERSIYLAFGHDEEMTGTGAKAIAQYFEDNDIRFEYILDEGLIIVNDALDGLDQPLAMIGTSEKGYLTLTLTAKLENGGHSTMPPKETAVGVLSKAIYNLQENPFPATLSKSLAELLRYAGPEMNLFNQIALSNLWLTEGIVLDGLAASESSNAMIRTTTAPTMLRGGIKDNVLPTRASAKVNFRILPGETKETVIEYVRKTIDDKRVIISIADPEGAFDPSPVASTSNFGFEVLQKTILEVFPEVAVAPGLFIGFTDSRHFIGLSDDIYRFAPLQLNQSELSSLHGINEKISVANYKKLIHFYQQLIQNSCK